MFETGEAEDLWQRYDRLLGVERLQDLYDRLHVEPHRTLGVIHLEDLIELDRPVPLAELRANEIRFARNIVSGRGLTLEEVALILELGGLGVEGAPSESGGGAAGGLSARPPDLTLSIRCRSPEGRRPVQPG